MHMRVSIFLCVLFCAQLITACDRAVKQPEIERREIVIEEIVEEVPPPPPPPAPGGRIKKFKNLQEWMLFACEDEPAKSMKAYRIGVFEVKEKYFVTLAGSHHFDEFSTNPAQFVPIGSLYELPQGEFKSLSFEQVREELSSQVSSFIKSNKFKKSCFANAKAMITEYDGKNLVR